MLESQHETGIALRLEGVTKAFGTRKALSGISFELPSGAFLSVLGHNGAGKTTLLDIIATLTKPSAGRIILNGHDTRENPEQTRMSLGLISHESFLYPHLSALENLEFYGRLYGVEHPHRRAKELLDMVGLTLRRDDLVGEFSRGMVQRVSIARALVHDPALILLDEPYSGLDPHAVEIFDEVLGQMDAGKTLIMVSHDLEKGLAMCTHALVLSGGEQVFYGPVDHADTAQIKALYYRSIGMRAG